MDVETFYDGYLASIMVEEGGVTPVGSAIALLAETEAEIEQARSKAQSSSSSETLDSDSPPQSGNPGVDVSSASRIDEDDKLKALIETPALDWSRQGQDGFGSRGFGRGFGRGMMAGRGFGIPLCSSYVLYYFLFPYLVVIVILISFFYHFSFWCDYFQYKILVNWSCKTRL
ncbi:dihydrolipoyllysine-residue acetyltransferase component 4 of pyruvate dehydrogenase complex, chloroplastic-like [Asparagus officinalis]|uniref:dihydrolipoyllysine-residue acetyltransferase component 4 of pyruvate dehydrogenase complex, chloroplastic-like n=1 Tax=Asparagus officinalis TaxID=4686 RepID=UPI00098E679A|nr:dihydrolipoyllysine-residue acetyltransferase component 4 of pyruvate dehydrogenase complex, chloroplastic-like [Asparagus officinalis]